MPPFVVSHDSTLTPAQAWDRVTDWPRHGDHVPLTTVRVTMSTPPGIGTVFSARTGVGRFCFEDPMEIVEWRPPAGDVSGFCRIQKRGRVILGWAELSVERHGDGSRTTWREEATPAKLPRFADGVSAASAKLLFGRVMRKLIDG